MASANKYINTQRVPHGTEDIQGHQETDDTFDAASAVVTDPRTEVDPVRKTEGSSFVSGQREEDSEMRDISVSSTKELELKSGLSTGQAGSSKKRRSSGADEQVTSETQSTSRLDQYGRVLKAMPVRKTNSGVNSGAEPLTASSEVGWAGTYGGESGEAPVAGPSGKRSPEDEGDEVHEDAQGTADSDTTMEDAAHPVEPHESSTYMTYRQRRSKKKQPAEPGSTTFKKRRVEGPTRTDFLQSLLDLLKSDTQANQTPQNQRMVQMLESRLAGRTARRAGRAARLEEREEDLDELTDGSYSYSSVPSDDFSEALEAEFEMDATASVHRNTAAFALRTTGEASGSESSDDGIIRYYEGNEDPPSSREFSVTSEGNQIPDSELEDASSADAVMDMDNIQVSDSSHDSRMPVDRRSAHPAASSSAGTTPLSNTTVSSRTSGAPRQPAPIPSVPSVSSVPSPVSVAMASIASDATAAAAPIAVPYASPVAKPVASPAAASPSAAPCAASLIAAPVAPPASPISTPAPAASASTPQGLPLSTMDSVIVQMRGHVATIKKSNLTSTATSEGSRTGVDVSRMPQQDHHSNQTAATTPQTVKVTRKQKRKDIAADAARGRLAARLDDETPMIVDPPVSPSSAPASPPRTALTAPVGQSRAKGPASEPGLSVGNPESIRKPRPSPLSTSIPMPEQKAVLEGQFSAMDVDAQPPLLTPRARNFSAKAALSSQAEDSASQSGTASPTPRGRRYSAMAALSSHAEDSASQLGFASPTPRPLKYRAKAEPSPDTDHSASQTGSSPHLSSPTPRGRKQRYKIKYERPASPTPSRQSLYPLLPHGRQFVMKGEPASDDDDSMGSIDPRSSLSVDNNGTPRARSVITKIESPNSDDESAALLTKVESPDSEEEAAILHAIFPEPETPPRHESPNPFDDVPGPKPIPAWLKSPVPVIDRSTGANRQGGSGRSVPSGIRGETSTSQGSNQASSSRSKQSRVSVDDTGGQTATVESTSRPASSPSRNNQSRVATERTGAQREKAATVVSTSRQGSSSRNKQARFATEGPGAQREQAATSSASRQASSSRNKEARVTAEGMRAQPAAHVASSSPGHSTPQQRPANDADDYATKVDVDLLKVAVEGLSMEVRAITSFLKQGGLNTSNHGESPSDGAAAGPSKGKSSSSKAKPSSKGESSSHTKSKQYASERDGYSGDSEEVEKLKQPIRHRSADHNQLSLDVQAHAMTLLGRANKSSPFPKRTIATAAEVRGFDPAEGECCTAKKFCIDISGTPASPWNESATRVFVKSFMTVAQFKCRNRKKIHDMFRSYFRTLQRHYHKVGEEKGAFESNEEDEDDTDTPNAPEMEGQSTSKKKKEKSSSSRNPNDTWFESSNAAKGKGKATATAPAEVDAKAHSRYQRKYMLWDRRYKIACRYRVLKDHAWILQKLGVDGMSSDEEEEGAPLRRYRVFVKPWRSKVVTEFLRILDALHRRYRQKAGAGTKRGSPPRLRYLCLDESTSKAVEKLPINAYDETWYATLKGLRKDDIAAKAPYDFTIDQSVIDAVAQYGPVELNGLKYV